MGRLCIFRILAEYNSPFMSKLYKLDEYQWIGWKMNKNIYKILIIVICFAFILLVALKEPHLSLEQEEQKDEVGSEEQAGSGEEIIVEEKLPVIELVRNPNLRILISNDDFSDTIHDDIRITSNKNFTLLGEDGTLYADYNAWEEINADSFSLKTGETLIFESEGKISVPSLSRAQGTPEYYGKVQIYKEENGYSLINIVPMEEYLLTVVPSEMPSGYPLEALKAQAICARSYAYYYVVNNAGLRHDAHMSDSTSFQVYNNIQETDATNLAVKETEGMVLMRDGLPVSTYFFSTSCGFTTNETIWKEYFGGQEFAEGEKPQLKYYAGSWENDKDVMFSPVAVAEPQAVEAISIGSDLGILYTADALAREDNFNAYIHSDASNFLEAEEQWYRWSYTGVITSEAIEKRLSERYAARPDLILTRKNKQNEFTNTPIQNVEKITDIKIMKRLDGGVADELLIETEGNDYLVIGEYNIRYVLSDGVSEIVRNDGSVVTVSNLLPSAYFIIEPESLSSETVETITLTGGGYGHGVGMSQNGAKQAALQGMTCEEILSLFYSGLELAEVK